jgi:hypothetical protein
VLTPVAELRPHPKNYRQHPADQLAHIKASLGEHGFYRNVVIARDGTILAGHGVVQAARELGIEQLPAVRLNLDPDDRRALKVLAGDNEIARSGIVDDRALTELLKSVAGGDLDQLLGTGFNAEQLAILTFTTRMQSEIPDMQAAREWVGMPAYTSEPAVDSYYLSIRFVNEAERQAFIERMGWQERVMGGEGARHKYYQTEGRRDVSSLRFDDA